jgi:hypothetical protein
VIPSIANGQSLNRIFRGKNTIPRRKLSTAVDNFSFVETTSSYRRHPQGYEQRRSVRAEFFFSGMSFFVDKTKSKIYELLLAHLRQDDLFLLTHVQSCFGQRTRNGMTLAKIQTASEGG